MATVDKNRAKQLTPAELSWLEEYVKDLPEPEPTRGFDIPLAELTLEQQVVVLTYSWEDRAFAEQLVYKTYLDEFVVDPETMEPISELPLDRKTGMPTYRGKTYDKPENWGRKPQQ